MTNAARTPIAAHARSNGGDEADQLYRLDLPGKQITLLTDPSERHSIETWTHASGLHS